MPEESPRVRLALTTAQLARLRDAVDTTLDHNAALMESATLAEYEALGAALTAAVGYSDDPTFRGMVRDITNAPALMLFPSL